MTLMNDDKSWWQKVLTMMVTMIIIIIGKTNPVASIAYYSTTPTHSFSLNLNVYRKDALNISFGVCVFPLSLQNNP